jgi:hypothetical protein
MFYSQKYFYPMQNDLRKTHATVGFNFGAAIWLG